MLLGRSLNKRTFLHALTQLRFIISTGDVYNFHFLKKVKVASIADAGGVHFSVPLNSSVKFGMLYNPDNDFRKSIQGYSFETVAALTVAKVIFLFRSLILNL